MLAFPVALDKLGPSASRLTAVVTSGFPYMQRWAKFGWYSAMNDSTAAPPAACWAGVLPLSALAVGSAEPVDSRTGSASKWLSRSCACLLRAPYPRRGFTVRPGRRTAASILDDSDRLCRDSPRGRGRRVARSPENTNIWVASISYPPAANGEHRGSYRDGCVRWVAEYVGMERG